MYFSAKDVHASHEKSLELCHQLSQGYLEIFEDYFTLSSGLAKRLLQESHSHVKSINHETTVSQLAEQTGKLTHRLLKEEIPSLISEAVHTSATRAEQLWDASENQLSGTKTLVGNFFARSLSASPWETFWLINAGQKTVNASLTTVDQLSAAALTATERIDEAVQTQFAPASRKARKPGAD